MGARGPAPKRSDQRRRKNETALPTTKAPGAAKVRIPRAQPGWHPIARNWYASLRESGQSQFYEPSDWLVATLIAESMSRDLQPQVIGITETGRVIKDTIPLKGASLAAYLRAFASLMVTEGDRRRMQMELQREQPTDPDAERAAATVTDIRARLGGGG